MIWRGQYNAIFFIVTVIAIAWPLVFNWETTFPAESLVTNLIYIFAVRILIKLIDTVYRAITGKTFIYDIKILD
jgi:hypothetical protein